MILRAFSHSITRFLLDFKNSENDAVHSRKCLKLKVIRERQSRSNWKSIILYAVVIDYLQMGHLKTLNTNCETERGRKSLQRLSLIDCENYAMIPFNPPKLLFIKVRFTDIAWQKPVSSFPLWEAAKKTEEKKIDFYSINWRHHRREV